MRHRSRHLRRLCALGLAAGALTLTGASEAGTKVTVKVTNIRSSEGVVRACMTTNPKKFPKCRGVAGAHAAVVKADGALTLTFNNVAPGTYAIALLHDENENGKADRALGMMPKEGFGFSRDAKVRMGPPKFDEAAFKVEGAPVSQTIKMRYML